MARRNQAKPVPAAKRRGLIVRSDDPLVSPKARRLKAQCPICGLFVDKETLRQHVRQVHKSGTPNARLQAILDDPALTQLRSFAVSPSRHEVEIGQWQTLCAYRQEVDWFAASHAARIDSKLLDEVMRVLRFVERAFVEGWIQVRRPPEVPSKEYDFSDPPGYNPPPIRVIRGGLPGSGR